MKAYACPFGSALEGTSRTSLGLFSPLVLCVSLASVGVSFFFLHPPPFFRWEVDASEMRRKRRRRQDTDQSLSCPPSSSPVSRAGWCFKPCPALPSELAFGFALRASERV